MLLELTPWCLSRMGDVWPWEACRVMMPQLWSVPSSGTGCHHPSGSKGCAAALGLWELLVLVCMWLPELPSWSGKVPSPLEEHAPQSGAGTQLSLKAFYF